MAAESTHSLLHCLWDLSWTHGACKNGPLVQNMQNDNDDLDNVEDMIISNL